MKNSILFFVAVSILACWLSLTSFASSACSQYSVMMAMPHWHYFGYYLKINSEATSDAEPEKTHFYKKTLKTWYDRYSGVISKGGLCMKGMIGDLKPDQNGIIHVKISIVVDRKGFDTSKPEVMYVDVKDKKKLKITDLSAHNWRSSYHKYQSFILYYLADDDHKK